MLKDEGFLLDMLLAARLLRQFTADKTWEEFRQDALLQSAVRYQEQILGEAANQISAEFRAEHREIPWDRLVGLRHRLVHGYRDLDLNRVWRVVERDVDRLIPILSDLIEPDHSGKDDSPDADTARTSATE